MSTEILLGYIRQHFSPIEGQALVSSLRHEPLVWQFFQDDATSSSFLSSSPAELDAFSPGRISIWLIAQETGMTLEDLLATPLAGDLAQLTGKAFETIINTGLPPTSLSSAGLLALALRNRRALKGNWSGISEEILHINGKQSVQKNFNLWKAPFASLFSFCDDFEDILEDLLQSKSEIANQTAIPLLVHAYLANPAAPEHMFERFFSSANKLAIDLQLAILKQLNRYGQYHLQKKLARQLMQTKTVADSFARIFSELEAFDAQLPDMDALEKQIRYDLPEDVNRLAAFHYYSGNDRQATQTYQKSTQLIDFIKSQTLFQSLSASDQNISNPQWISIINGVPNSAQARLIYIKKLVNEQKYNEATTYLDQLPPSIAKQLTGYQIEKSTGTGKASLPADLLFNKNNTDPETTLTPGYYVHPIHHNPSIEILEEVLAQEDLAVYQGWVEDLLEKNYYNPQIVLLTRNFYEKTHQLHKAIALTSFLEIQHPQNFAHKSNLARLYSLAGRWTDTFDILQASIKAETTPEIEDLERFAEAALRTDRFDMAISICQNIITRDPLNTKALVLLGESYMDKGDPIKAIQHMEQVVEAIPDAPDTWLTLARLWEKNQQTDRAFEILNKAVLALPNEPELLRALGKAHLERQSPSDAVTHLRKAYEISSDHLQGKIDLARAEYQLGLNEKAWRLLEPFMQNYQNVPEVSELLGRVLVALGKKHAAIPVYLSAAKSNPDDFDVILTAARLVLEESEALYGERCKDALEQVQEILNTSLGKDPEHTQLRLHHADILRINGLHQEAWEAYRQLAEQETGENSHHNWRLNYGLGKTAIALGNIDIGLAALQDAASDQPENLLVLHALSEAYLAADLRGKSESFAKSSIKLAPDDVNNILWYANFKTRNNEPEEAVQALKEALQINPERVELKLWLAKSQISVGSSGDALAIVKQLIQGDVATADERHQAAHLCVQVNEIALAVRALESARHLDRNCHPLLLMDLAVGYSLIGQWKNAIETLDVSDESCAEHPQLVLLKSDLLSNLGRYSAAVKTLESIDSAGLAVLSHSEGTRNNQSQSPLLYRFDFTQKGYLYKLGQMNRGVGEISKAQEYLEKALELDPADVNLRLATAEAFTTGLNFDHALEILNAFDHQNPSVDEIANNHLQVVCAQVENLLAKEEYKQAEILARDLEESPTQTPRTLAISSRIASISRNTENATNQLNDAISAVQANPQDAITPSADNLFTDLMTLVNIAEAARLLDDHNLSIQYHQQAWKKLNNQPYQNLCYLNALIKAAEAQQISEAVLIRAHAPGKDMLSESNQQIAQALLETVKPLLSQDTYICLKARATAAMSGEWPLSLNIDACLVGPDEAAALIIASDDHSLVQDILETYQNDPQVLQAYGVFALKNDRKDGKDAIEKALSIDTTNPINHALLGLLTVDSPNQAIKSLEAALAIWQDEPEWHAIIADLYQQSGNSEEAALHIAEALKDDPENAKYWQESASIKIKNNDLLNAKTDLEKSTAIYSEDPVSWIKLAEINKRLGNIPEALQNFQEAKDLKPEDLDIATQEICFLIDQRNYQDAESKAQEELSDHADHNPLRILLARAQAKQGKFDAANQTLSLALEQTPNDPSLVLEKLHIRKDQEGVEPVLSDLITLAQDHPNDVAVLTTLTDWLIQTNRLQKAAETAQTVLRIFPESAEIHLMLGRLQRKSGQLDQAIAHLSEAITKDPCLVEAYLELGKTYQDRRNLEEAIKVYQKASQANASDPRPYYFAGMALKECKDYSAAEAMLKQAKRYSPDDATIIRQLGVITTLNLINNLRETR